MAPKKKVARVKAVKIQSISLRRGTVRAEDASLLADVKLSPYGLDTIPDQIRSALFKKRQKIMDVFQHVDEDFNRHISMLEFVRGLQEIGLEASEEDIGAVFLAMDVDRSGAIETHELHNLLSRSVQSHPRLEPIETHVVQQHGLRTEKVGREDANLLAGLVLDRHDEEYPIPNQIRDALREQYYRVIDLFKQFDESNTGTVTLREFIRGMTKIGLDAPMEAFAALYKSFDPHEVGVIRYEDFNNLIARSSESHPVLPPLDVKAMNQIGLRTAKVSQEDANLLQGFEIDPESLDSIPHQIRLALYKNKLRVIDLFRQIDDDASGLIDLAEFKKAMKEFGWEPHDDALNYVFSTFDCDSSGNITYLELDRLCRASTETYPRLFERRNAIVNQEEIIAQMLRERALRFASEEARAAVSRPNTARAGSRPQTAATQRPQTAAPAIEAPARQRPSWASMGEKVKVLVAHERQKSRPVTFNPVTIFTRSGEELQAYELINISSTGANRGSDKMAIVCHPITGAGGASDGTKQQKLSMLLLHRHLQQEGFNVLAYEAHPLAVGGVQTGELQQEYLLAAMDYVSEHRSFKYCKIALMAQGVGAAAAFVAISKNPELFEGRVRVISACQPAELDGTTMEELLTTHVPRCNIPTLLSRAESGVKHIATINHEYMTAKKIHDALGESVPKDLIEVSDYPLFGKARRFDGAQFFGDHAEKLAFITEHTATRKPRIPIPHF